PTLFLHHYTPPPPDIPSFPPRRSSDLRRRTRTPEPPSAEPRFRRTARPCLPLSFATSNSGKRENSTRRARHPTVPHNSPNVNPRDRKSTRLNSSHLGISYAVFCLKKKK